MPFASGTHLARRSLFSSWAGTLQNHRRLWFPNHFNLVVGSDYKFYASNVVTRKLYFRRRRVRLSTRFRLRPELSLPSRFAFTATCCRYRRTISSPEAPAIRRAVASKAASIFSLTISLASRRALLPPRISFIIRSATTPFASTANIIKELNIRRPLQTASG